MHIDELQRHWEEFGRRNPMWAILTEPDKKGAGQADRTAGEWNPDEFFATGRAVVTAIADQLRPFDLPRERRRALDFGCGLGRLTQATCEHFEHATGVDIAASMIDGARRYNRFSERCEYVHNTRADLAFVDDGSVDFVLSLLVLQHMRTELAQGYIAEFVRVLRSGGVAVFQVPYAGPPGFDAASRGDSDEPVMEMHATPRERVVEIVERAGGRLVASREDDGGGNGWQSYVYVVARD